MNKDLLPITPVAHYACGGVPTDLHGETRLPGLFAVGEVAYTGVHGANRLASNSLLEAVVFSQFIADHLSQLNLQFDLPDSKNLTPPKVVTEVLGQLKGYSQRIGQIMWDHVGIVRTQDSLREAKKEIMSISPRDYRIQNRLLVCEKIIDACMKRTESLGCHYMAESL